MTPHQRRRAIQRAQDHIEWCDYRIIQVGAVSREVGATAEMLMDRGGWINRMWCQVALWSISVMRARLRLLRWSRARTQDYLKTLMNGETA